MGVDHGPDGLEGVDGDAGRGEKGDGLPALQRSGPGGVGRVEQGGVVRLFLVALVWFVVASSGE